MLPKPRNANEIHGGMKQDDGMKQDGGMKHSHVMKYNINIKSMRIIKELINYFIILINY